MKYLAISEELRNKLVIDEEEFSSHLDYEHKEAVLGRKKTLLNLTPVQSSEDTSKDVIDCRCMCEKCESRTKETYFLGVVCSNCGWAGKALIRKGDSFPPTKECLNCGNARLHTTKPPISIPTPQPEALEVDDTRELLNIGWKWLDNHADGKICSNRSCIRCRLADVFFELEKQHPEAIQSQSTSQKLGEKELDEYVNRFLAWKLPLDFTSDCRISYIPPRSDERYPQHPIGTNLFTYTQAKEMLRYVLGINKENPE